MASIGIGGLVDARAFVGTQTSDGLTPAKSTLSAGPQHIAPPSLGFEPSQKTLCNAAAASSCFFASLTGPPGLARVFKAPMLLAVVCGIAATAFLRLFGT